MAFEDSESLTVATPTPSSPLTDPTVGTFGGATPSKAFSAATTNANAIKTSKGQLYGFDVTIPSTVSGTYYLKFYDKASAPVVGTDVPKLVYAISSPGLLRNFPLGDAFVNGIAWALTGGQADNDTTAAVTGITLNFHTA